MLYVWELLDVFEYLWAKAAWSDLIVTLNDKVPHGNELKKSRSSTISIWLGSVVDLCALLKTTVSKNNNNANLSLSSSSWSSSLQLALWKTLIITSLLTLFKPSKYLSLIRLEGAGRLAGWSPQCKPLISPNSYRVNLAPDPPNLNSIIFSSSQMHCLYSMWLTIWPLNINSSRSKKWPKQLFLNLINWWSLSLFLISSMVFVNVDFEFTICLSKSKSWNLRMEIGISIDPMLQNKIYNETIIHSTI